MNWYILSLISAFFSALAAIFEKKTLFKENVLGFCAVISFFNLIFTIPFFFLINFSDISLVHFLILFFKTLLGASAFFCVMAGIKNLELSSALPLLVLTPGLVAVIALIFLKEVLNIYQVSGMILLMSGTYILPLKNRQKLLEPFRILFSSKGYHYIIIALLLFTATSIMDKILLVKYRIHPYSFLGFQHLFYFMIFNSIFLIKRRKKSLLMQSVKNSGKWILYVSLCTIIYRYTQIEAIKLGPVALVLSLKRISVFFAAVIGGKIFKEHNLLIKSIATVILIAGSILIILF